MPNKKFEEQLAALDEFREGSGDAAAVEGLRKALANRNNYLVAKAAKIAAAGNCHVLVPDLIAALDRFFVNPSKSDPQCWAKNAIVKALADLGHDDAEVYLLGLRHVQMEAVWGGQQDTAGTLRSQCALALVQCRSIGDLALLTHLVDLLFDREKIVRVETARAIGRIDRPESALILRVRAMAGDEEPEVFGACCSALLSIEGADAIGFVSRFLDRGDSTAEEAALALGLLPDARALAALTERWPREKNPDIAYVLLTAIALMRLPEAAEFLIHLCETVEPETGARVVRALAAARVAPEVRELVDAAVARNGDPTVRAAFQKYFG